MTDQRELDGLRCWDCRHFTPREGTYLAMCARPDAEVVVDGDWNRACSGWEPRKDDDEPRLRGVQTAGIEEA